MKTSKRQMNILEQYQILNERLLTSDFTFGFELEGVMASDSSMFAEVMDNAHLLGDEYDAIKDYIDAEMYAGELGKNYGGDSDCGRDESLSPDNNEDGDFTFEYSSPIIPCTPAYFQRVINVLNKLLQNGVYTNPTCGFHHHISFKGMDERAMVWIYCNMAADPAFYEEFSRFEDKRLYDIQFARYNSLNKLGDAILERNYQDVLYYLTTDKWRAFRLHPQGTIEWRGPRDFLNDPGMDTVKDFYLLLIKLLNKIKTYMDNKTIEGTTIKKEEFFDNLTNAVQNLGPNNRQPDLEFLIHDTTYIHDPALKIKRKHIPGVINQAKLYILLNQLILKPNSLYKLILSGSEYIDKLIKAIEGDRGRLRQLLFVLKKLDETTHPKKQQAIQILVQKLRPTFVNFSDYYNLVASTVSSDYFSKDFIRDGLLTTVDLSSASYLLRALCETKYPLSLKDIEDTYYHVLTSNTNFSIISLLSSIVTSFGIGEEVTEETQSKLLMWCMKTIIYNKSVTLDVNKRDFDTDIVDIVKRVLTNTNRLEEWNQMVYEALPGRIGLRKLYFNDLSIKELIKLMKSNSKKNLSHFLNANDIATLKAENIYIKG